jgi:hypothetical protein
MDYEPKTSNLSLEERLADRPELLARMRLIADELEQADGQLGSLDEVEDRVVVMLRQLGVEVLRAQAERMAAEASPPSGRTVRRHQKKRSAG